MAYTGKVLRFDDVRGYGFIVPDGGGEDVFVHANELLDEKTAFSPGTPVEFEVTQGDRGLKAFAVRVTGGKQAPAVEAAPASQPEEDDGLCDVLSLEEFNQELTEFLLVEAPELTGAQIIQLRRSLLTFAQKHGWAEG